jgi:hypothetical protein
MNNKLIPILLLFLFNCNSISNKKLKEGTYKVLKIGLYSKEKVNPICYTVAMVSDSIFYVKNDSFCNQTDSKCRKYIINGITMIIGKDTMTFSNTDSTINMVSSSKDTIVLKLIR